MYEQAENIEQSIRPKKKHSILGTLKLNLMKNEKLELVQEVLDFDELVIPTSGESHLVYVLDYDFYTYPDKFELDLVVKFNMDEDTTLIAKWWANDIMNDQNLEIGHIDIKDLTGNIQECKVIDAEIDLYISERDY